MAKMQDESIRSICQYKNAEYYAGIRSYIETCKRNNINEHIALVKLLDGNPYTIEERLKSSDNHYFS